MIPSAAWSVCRVLPRPTPSGKARQERSEAGMPGIWFRQADRAVRRQRRNETALRTRGGQGSRGSNGARTSPSRDQILLTKFRGRTPMISTGYEARGAITLLSQTPVQSTSSNSKIATQSTNRRVIVPRDKDVRGFEVPVNDPHLVGMLYRLADAQERPQPLAGRQLALVAVLRDRNAFDQFHHEVRSAGVRGARVEDLGDVRMIHHRQGPTLGFEAGDDLLGVHPGLDDLQGDAAADGVLLLGHVDRTEAAFADELKE